jgi:hypothetical protein
VPEGGERDVWTRQRLTVFVDEPLADLVQRAVAAHYEQALDPVRPRLVHQPRGVARAPRFDELSMDSALLQQSFQFGKAAQGASAACCRVTDHAQLHLDRSLHERARSARASTVPALRPSERAVIRAVLEPFVETEFQTADLNGDSHAVIVDPDSALIPAIAGAQRTIRETTENGDRGCTKTLRGGLARVH